MEKEDKQTFSIGESIFTFTLTLTAFLSQVGLFIIVSYILIRKLSVNYRKTFFNVISHTFMNDVYFLGFKNMYILKNWFWNVHFKCKSVLYQTINLDGEFVNQSQF